ncbi:MAG: hypothetical protein ACK40M_05200 [Flavobacteriales bacterium]
MKEFSLLRSFLLIALSLILSVALAQEDEEQSSGLLVAGKFYFGINAGGYLANKHTANYYAGYNDFTIPELIAIPQIYSQIYTVLQSNFRMGEFPANPRYRTGINLGLNLGYYLDESMALYSNIDIVRLKFQEVFTLEADNPANPSGDPIVYPQSIIGEENRMIIDLGLHFDFGDPGKPGGYFEIFGSFNATRARKNEVIIENNLRYSLLSQPNVYNRVNLGGVGYGLGIGTGVRVKFNRQYTFDLGATAAFHKIALWDDRRLKLNPLIYVRLLWL